MVNFLNTTMPLLMQVNRSEGGTLLPWPNGSLLSGRLMPPTEGAGAMLMLGNYRMRIEVPPNTPMGQAWLQLMQREMPGQFRLLSDKQAIALIAEMLQKGNHKTGQVKGSSQQVGSDKAQQQPASQNQAQSEWTKFQSEGLPFAVETYGERLMLLDKENGGTQGLLQKEEGKQGFMLHGRLDLQNMGATAFSLEGKDGSPWKISLHMANPNHKQHIEQMFATWLKEKQQNRATSTLEGQVYDAIPQSFGSSTDRTG